MNSVKTKTSISITKVNKMLLETNTIWYCVILMIVPNASNIYDITNRMIRYLFFTRIDFLIVHCCD